MASVAELLPHYDAWILDQWGVLHAGEELFPEAQITVDALVASGKSIAILSNSSRSAEATLAALAAKGMNMRRVKGAVTSGEQLQRFLKDPQCPYRGQSVTLVTHEHSDTSLEAALDTAAMPVVRDGTGSVILIHGIDRIVAATDRSTTYSETGDVSEFLSILEEGIARGCDLLCANPDIVARKPDGQLQYVQGGIARAYEDMGGTVVYFGKPDPRHFQACVDMLAVPRDRVLHVGDSLAHDIAGASAAGIDSLWITDRGVHAEQLQHHSQQHLCDKYSAMPTYTLPNFAT